MMGDMCSLLEALIVLSICGPSTHSKNTHAHSHTLVTHTHHYLAMVHCIGLWRQLLIWEEKTWSHSMLCWREGDMESSILSWNSTSTMHRSRGVCVCLSVFCPLVCVCEFNKSSCLVVRG